MSQHGCIFPNFRDENKQIFELPPRNSPTNLQDLQPLNIPTWIDMQHATPLQLDQQWQSLVRILQNHLREVLPGGKISGAKVDRILMVQKSGKLTSWGSGSLSHYSQGFGIHPWWCRMSEPSTVGLQDKKQVVENWAKMWQQAMDLKAGAVSVRTPCRFSC